MGLAGAARAQGDDVLAPLDPLAARQFQYLRLVQRGDGLEVEAVKALGDRELRCLDAPLDHAAFATDPFQLHQLGQELNMIQALGRAMARHFIVFPQEGCQRRSKISPPGRSKTSPLNVMRYAVLGGLSR